MDLKLSKAKQILEKYNQTHIIPFLEEGKNTKLINQILETNFEALKDLYNKTKGKKSLKTSNIEPIIAFNPDKLPKKELDKIKNIGEEIIKQNKFAVSTMAGRTRN